MNAVPEHAFLERKIFSNSDKSLWSTQTSHFTQKDSRHHGQLRRLSYSGRLVLKLKGLGNNLVKNLAQALTVDLTSFALRIRLSLEYI